MGGLNALELAEQAAQHHGHDAASLGESVLDAVPAASLRATTRQRLRSLVADLDSEPAGRALTERVASLS